MQSSYSTSFALYHLARNPNVQERLHSECCQLLPTAEDSINADSLAKKATYARAVLKESLRLNPISVGVGRILNNDMILSGYHVPKKTVVVTQNMVACRLAKHFDRPNEFIPERWLRNSDKLTVNPFLVLPFGHGSRSCIARRLAEQNILILLIRVCVCLFFLFGKFI